MPSASAKLEKQASTEANDPIRQGITIIEHKIRNLEKRKLRLEGYKDQQSSGKELNSDQLSAIAKYDEVLQTLEFARDLCKQFNTIAGDTVKQQKKLARKEASERTQQELAKVKEVLLIQDILANMGQEVIREDFLAGQNGASKLTEENLQHLDDLYTHVMPKREVEEGGLPFTEQLQKAAEHLLSLTEGKNKEIVGSTYTQLRQLIHDIHSCGYFDVCAPAVVAAVPEASGEPVCEEEDVECEEEPVSVPTTTFQPSKPVPQATQGQQPQQILGDAGDQSSVMVIPPQQPPVSEVISSVMAVGNSSFHFLQESELDSPDVIVPTAPPPSALPIPTQTFTNQNFVATPQTYAQKEPQQQQQPVYAPVVIPIQPASYAAYATGAQQAPQHQATYQQPPPQQQQQPPPPVEQISDWSQETNAIESSDWNAQCEAASTSPDNAWQQPKHHHQQSSWASEITQNNDGFVTAGRGGSGRGGRGRGGNSRGGPRGGGGGRTGSGGSGGGNYYRNNNSNDNGYYQSNGFQHRNSGSGDRRGTGSGGGGGGGGQRGGSGGPRSDRGGPRGFNNRGGRGGNRNQQ